jgi:hypothetical protein
MKRLLIVVFVLCMFAVLPTGVMANPGPQLTYGPETATSACDKGKLVVNVIQSVVNDIDSGTNGYWAIDNYHRHISVRQIDDTTFCAVLDYNGQFTTFASTSPGVTDSPLSAGITGTMHGGYRAIIEGTFDPQWDTRGSLGEFDYGCTPPNDSTCTDRPDWVAQYFPSGYDFEFEWWGFIYQGGNNGTWVNSSDGNEGDITG